MGWFTDTEKKLASKLESALSGAKKVEGVVVDEFKKVEGLVVDEFKKVEGFLHKESSAAHDVISQTAKDANADVEKLKADLQAAMAKAAQLPGSTVGQIPMYYFGREVRFAGNRSFTDWTLQIINDEDFAIRNAMERWMNNINSHAGNTRNNTSALPSNYSVDAEVIQYGKTGKELKRYKFVGLFPLDLAPIDLDWGSNDTIEEFSVTFAYQYWETDTTN